ncbi:uncharacterized protein BP01DRAFT_6640 [Aspergillus saccharolyticus JOP 1030-1]|uniref:F-box domain-containing protein n=1 Tax=Aspergillus saccharolyticus JOP 1030-1 TaxID=1450539 RepID=A0A318ZZU7_9EURO|nr:hypothetical protein BP01DRAFT_6640 [Aspergillus saccharolyticus JOP 1030-1]PYH49793.1 hypothetical protein BP01DRAFT_6640 [Aspergillus saccharolyticus JOP 1030-1]
MEHLPRELILSIGRLSQNSTLCSLVRCCRRLHDILEPLIYSKLRLVPPLSNIYVSLFMRLWRHPDLARLVRLVEIHLPIFRQGQPQYQLNEDKVPDLPQFIQDVQNELFDPKDTRPRVWWGSKMRSGDWSFWLGVMLVRWTHLESVEFVGLYNNHAICDLLYRAGKRHRPFHETPPYPLLRRVAVRDCEQGFDLEEVLTPFFYFPAVETVDVAQLWEGRGREEDLLSWRRENSHARCPVRRITIRSLKHSRGTLTWLADCSDLEHISLHIACIYVGDPDIRFGVPFDPPRFLRALLPFTDRL